MRDWLRRLLSAALKAFVRQSMLCCTFLGLLLMQSEGRWFDPIRAHQQFTTQASMSEPRRKYRVPGFIDAEE
jgi:hypothetical protein